MNSSDAWDWNILLYVGTTILHRSEAAFWRMTPRKLNALTKAHVELKSPSEEEETLSGFIDDAF